MGRRVSDVFSWALFLALAWLLGLWVSGVTIGALCFWEAWRMKENRFGERPRERWDGPIVGAAALFIVGCGFVLAYLH